MKPARRPQRHDDDMIVIEVIDVIDDEAHVFDAGPSRALAVTFMAPVFAVFYGAVFLGEPVTAWMLGCAAVIVGGTLLSTGLIRRPAKAAQGAEQA